MHSHRVTRATPSTSIVFHPVSSQISQAGTLHRTRWGGKIKMQNAECKMQNEECFFNKCEMQNAK
jgi:hypothetical protein